MTAPDIREVPALDPDPLDGTVAHVHDWTPSEYPAVQYPGISDWAGTMRCRTCRDGFRWWTNDEEAAYWQEVADSHGLRDRSSRLIAEVRPIFPSKAWTVAAFLGVFVTGLLLGAAVARVVGL